MAHQIEIQLGQFSQDDHHKVRTFVETVWREVSKRGWAEFENFDQRINPGAKFQFKFPPRASHEATVLIDKMVRHHFMTGVVTVTHNKRNKIDG